MSQKPSTADTSGKHPLRIVAATPIEAINGASLMQHHRRSYEAMERLENSACLVVAGKPPRSVLLLPPSLLVGGWPNAKEVKKRRQSQTESLSWKSRLLFRDDSSQHVCSRAHEDVDGTSVSKVSENATARCLGSRTT